MQKIVSYIFIFSIFAFSTNAHAQNEKSSCCAPASATAEFAALGQDKSFVMAHDEPVESSMTNSKGKMTVIPTDGQGAMAYEIKNETATSNYLFVFHEWWGLNDQIKSAADKLAKKIGNVNVLALDLYDGKVTSNRDSASAYMQNANSERILEIIHGAKKYAGENAKVATVGWCFGGGWSLQAAIELGDNAEACVIYYGMPEKDKERLAKLKAPVLGIFATEDGWINKELVEEFETKMKEVNVDYEIHWYEAQHAFANPSNPQYDKKAAKDARDKTVEFIKSNF